LLDRLQIRAEDQNPLRDEILQCDLQYSTVNNVEHNGNDMYLGRRVADVSLVYNNGKQLRMYLAIQRLVRLLHRERASFNFFNSRCSSQMTRKQRRTVVRLKRRMQFINARIKTMDKKARKQSARYLDVKGAFVTFQQPSSRTIALDNYRTSGYWLARLFQPRSLRMRAYALKVEPAVHPHNVVWANIGEGWWSLLVRRSVANVLLLVVLSASVAFVSYSSAIQHTVLATHGTDHLVCHRDLPSLFYGSYEAIPPVFNLRLVRGAGGESGTGEGSSGEGSSGEGNVTVSWDVHLPTVLPYASACARRGGQLYTYDPPPTRDQVHTLLGVMKRAVAYSPALDDSAFCVDVINSTAGVIAMCDTPAAAPPISRWALFTAPDFDATRSCAKLSCFVDGLPIAEGASFAALQYSNVGCESIPTSTAQSCFCRGTLNELIRSKGTLRHAAQALVTEGGVCSTMGKEQLRLSNVQAFAGVAVGAANILSTQILIALSDYERHTTASARAASISTKAFIACFVNTALLTVLCQGESSPSPQYSDFDWEWYPYTGSRLLLAMLWNIIMPHVPFLIGWNFVRPLRRWLVSHCRTIVTQEQMDVVYDRTCFCVEARVPFVLNTVCCALMFSGGMPILLPLAAITIWFQCLVDKYAVLYVHQKPPDSASGPELMLHLTELLPCALVLHVGISIWAYSNTEIKVHHVLQQGLDLDLNAEHGSAGNVSTWADIAVDMNGGRLTDSVPVLMLIVIVAVHLGWLLLSKVVGPTLHTVWRLKRGVMLESKHVSGYTDLFEMGAGALHKGMVLVKAEGGAWGGDQADKNRWVPDFHPTYKQLGWSVLLREEEGWERRNREQYIQQMELQLLELKKKHRFAMGRGDDEEVQRSKQKEFEKQKEALEATMTASRVPLDRMVTRRAWSANGTCHEVKHIRSTRMRSWQVMAGQQYTYRAEANPRYLIANMMKQKAKKEETRKKLVDEELLVLALDAIAKVSEHTYTQYTLIIHSLYALDAIAKVRKQFGAKESSLDKASDRSGVTVHKLTEFLLGPVQAAAHMGAKQRAEALEHTWKAGLGRCCALCVALPFSFLRQCMSLVVAFCKTIYSISHRWKLKLTSVFSKGGSSSSGSSDVSSRITPMKPLEELLMEEKAAENRRMLEVMGVPIVMMQDAAAIEGLFERMDLDGNGELDRTEFMIGLRFNQHLEALGIQEKSMQNGVLDILERVYMYTASPLSKCIMNGWRKIWTLCCTVLPCLPIALANRAATRAATMSDEDHITILFAFLDRERRGRVSAVELTHNFKDINQAISLRSSGLSRVRWSADRFHLDSFVFWSTRECRWFFRGGGLGDPLSTRRTIQQTDIANAVRAHRKFFQALSASARLRRWLHRLWLEVTTSIIEFAHTCSSVLGAMLLPFTQCLELAWKQLVQPKKLTRDKSAASKSKMINQLKSAKEHLAAQRRQEEKVAKMHRKLARSLEKLNAPHPAPLNDRAGKVLKSIATKASSLVAHLHLSTGATQVPVARARKARRASMDIRPGQLAMYANEGAQGEKSKPHGAKVKRKGRGSTGKSGDGSALGEPAALPTEAIAAPS
jgi:hypothetical protein